MVQDVDAADVEDVLDSTNVADEVDVPEPEEVAAEAPSKTRPKAKTPAKTPGETPVKVEEKKRDGPAVF